MARSPQITKLVSSLFLDGASSAIAMRGFAAAAAGGAASSTVIRTGGASGGVALKRAAEGKVKPVEKVSWGPDPKTGYYRPESTAVEVDVADLRTALLGRHSH